MSSSGKNDAGLMSSAGLVRYFDSEEDRGLKIDHRTCLVLSLLVGFAVRLASAVVV